MKRTSLLTAIVFFAMFTAKAQNRPAEKPFLVHTIYLNSTLESRQVNVDSLLQIYKKYILDANPYITASKIVRHWYGHDSREVLVLTEYKSWDDVVKADAKQDAIEDSLPKSLDEAGKQWFSVLFPEHHSDEIYQVVAE
jgi:hypothetical protein